MRKFNNNDLIIHFVEICASLSLSLSLWLRLLSSGPGLRGFGEREADVDVRRSTFRCVA